MKIPKAVFQLGASIMCMLTAVSPASAAVHYDFQSTVGSFSFNLPDYISDYYLVNANTPDLSSTASSIFLCNYVPACGLGSVPFGSISFQGTDGSRQNYLFEAGFLGHDGTYQPLDPSNRVDLNPTKVSFVVSTLASPGVPEPVTWTLMVAGFGLVGAGMRRKVASTDRLGPSLTAI